MRIKYYIITVTVLLFGLSSCIYTAMTFLSEDDLKWVKNIPNSIHPVIFKSNRGNIDTIVYSRKWIHNDKKWYAASENSNGVREAHAGYDFHFINHTTSKYKSIGFDGYFGIYRELNNDVLQSSFSFSNIRSLSVREKKRDLNPLFKIKLNNKIYNNCFVIDSLNSSSKTSKYLEMRELTKFIICKGKGLVYYEYKDGEAFTIVE